MSDFVHLHLHSEYSLLDGACRIEELLDKAVELKMPAMAITEHGNMFSSVIFHDQARKRGINPILGCEVYVAPGDRRTKSGTPGETANHLVLLAETNEGYHNLIKLVSCRLHRRVLLQAAHRQGPAGAALDRADRPEQLPERGGRHRHPHRAAAEGARTRRPLIATSSGAKNFFLEMQYQGIEDQQVVNIGLQPIAKDLGLAARRHQRRPLPAELRLQAARHPAVHRHRQDGQRRRAAAAITATSST